MSFDSASVKPSSKNQKDNELSPNADKARKLRSQLEDIQRKWFENQIDFNDLATRYIHDEIDDKGLE